jgi:hypothetical protein
MHMRAAKAQAVAVIMIVAVVIVAAVIVIMVVIMIMVVLMVMSVAAMGARPVMIMMLAHRSPFCGPRIISRTAVAMLW